MNETAKTGIFVAVAAVLALVAWSNRSNLPEAAAPAEMRNQLLFPEFKDPLKAASLEIVEYDEATATPRPFKVAQVKGSWSIPSHDGYPTDAKDQLAEAAGSLLDLKVLEVASDSRGDHSMYGVLEPDPKTLQAGATGVGTRVAIRDKDDKPLLSLVIGKAVPGRDGLRYVRRTGQDPVYVVALKTDKLTARFGDWIEKDLLKFSSFDMKQLQIQDYSIDLTRGVQNVRGVLRLTYDDTASDAKWKLVEDKSVKGQELVANTLGANEEINTTTLDDLKTALADLKIVDVNRKPAGLSGDLKASGKLKPDDESAQSLSDRGFHLARSEGGYVLLSDQGEIDVGMKDGVEYILRFGEIAGQGEAKTKTKGKGNDAKKDEPAGVNRFLFVMAEFNRDAITKPVPEKVPDEPKAEKADASKKAADKKDSADKKVAAEKTDPKTEWKAQKERIEKENQRKQDEYDSKVKEGKQHVDKLNARFADWYYVIDDGVYQKIHLNRQKIVKKKEKKDEGKEHAHDHHDDDHDHDHDHAAESPKETFTPSDFDDLKKSGVKSP